MKRLGRQNAPASNKPIPIKAVKACEIDMHAEKLIPARKGSNILNNGYLGQKALFLNGIGIRFSHSLGVVLK